MIVWDYALFAFSFIGQNFMIPSASMENTLLIGDHLLVDRTTFAAPTAWAPFVHYRPVQRGDIIVFLKPNPETPDLILVKRVIGARGDRVHLSMGLMILEWRGAERALSRLGPRDDRNAAACVYPVSAMISRPDLEGY